MPDYRLGKLNGRFVAVWAENGKRHRWRLIANSPAEARAALRAFARERDALRRPSERLTVTDIWADYVADRKKEGKVAAPRMVDAWKRLGPVFGDLVPSHIDRDGVRDYIAQRRGQGASDGTTHTELGYLRAALRHGLGGAAPTITLPPKPRPRSRHLTASEAQRLIDAAQVPHVRLYMLLALYTAGRPSSLLDLSWDRVDFRLGRISLDNPDRDRTAKGRATVPLADAILPDLQEARSSARSEYVIEWAGERVGSVKKAIKATAKRAGLEGVTPYVLRHTAAVWMAEGGVSMDELAQYLGHNNPATTFKTYARFSPEYLRKASDAITERLAQGSEVAPNLGAGTQTEPTEHKQGLETGKKPQKRRCSKR